MPTCAIAPQTRGVRVVLGRAQAARLLHRHHLLLVGRLTLRHVVHLVDRLGGEVVRLSARLSLGHRLGSCCARGPQGTTRNVVCVRTGTAGSSLLLTLVWIVFTEVSSASRSGSGLTAGIWCSGIIYSLRADGPRGTKVMRQPTSHCRRDEAAVRSPLKSYTYILDLTTFVTLARLCVTRVVLGTRAVQ